MLRIVSRKTRRGMKDGMSSTHFPIADRLKRSTNVSVVGGGFPSFFIAAGAALSSIATSALTIKRA
jgi:hypothetical protein